MLMLDIAGLVALLFVILMLCGVWIGVALGIGGLWLYLARGGWDGLQSVGFVAFNSLTSYEFVALPLFVFMATILASCGISRRLYDSSAAVVGWMPGGLLHANIAGSGLFASICGSTAATCAAMSTIGLPELRKRNYPDGPALGSLAAGGTLGPMIPPSLGFIIYGVMTDTSIGQLFMAGVMPGIVIALLFMIYIILRSLLLRDGLSEPWLGFGPTLRLTVRIWPVIMLFGMVLGTMYMGIATAVEAGALGCLGSLVVAAGYRALTFENLSRALNDGVTISALIFFVLLGGIILGHGFSNMGVPQYLIELVIENDMGRTEFLIVCTLMFLLLGLFMDGAAMMVVTLPLIFPVVLELDINPVWFGVIMVLFTEMAAITPPVGVNLFVLQGVTKSPLETISKGVFPFLLALLVAEVIFVLWPAVVLWLPQMMY